MWSVIYRIGSYFVGIARYISYDFLFVEQEFGVLHTILQNKQIKAHYTILLVEKQKYFIVLMAFRR